MRHRIRAIAITCTVIYTGALLGVMLLLRTDLDGLWWMRLAANFLPYLFSPLLVLLPLVVFSRSRLAGVVVCVPCVIFYWLYGDLFLPNVAGASHRSGQALTVMSYNVTIGEPGGEQILSIIENGNADVVALQELPFGVAEALSRLGERYPYQALHPTRDAYSGSGVLSRFPILYDEAFPLVEDMHLYQHVVLDVGGERVHVLNVHLQPPEVGERWLGGYLLLPTAYHTAVQDRELDCLIEELDGLEETVVVVGDFNMTDQSSGYRRLTRRLGDAHREAGWGLGHTFPDGEVGPIPTVFPLIRIDYIFHSSDLMAERAYVGGNGGPNHRFVVAELSF
jgi:vancomycin resistance protein VanJ